MGTWGGGPFDDDMGSRLGLGAWHACQRIRFVLAAATVALAACASVQAGAAGVVRDRFATRMMLLGRSVEGRRIVAIETGDLDSSRRALIVGCIHGNEIAGVALANQLATTTAPTETDLWILPSLNPDGVANRSRGNAHGVDLNRNFPWGWRPLSGTYDSGPHPLSEPETRIAAHVIERIRPELTIWFHQHLDLVDDSVGNRTIERRFARTANLRLAALQREPGSAVTWESHLMPRATSFVVELPAGSLPSATLTRLARAVRVATTLIVER